MYPAIDPTRKTGEEPFKTVTGKEIGKLIDFWQWAHSDLIGNTERGAIAEYLVACALGIQNGIRISWDKYDLVSREGIAIEVKTSGYLQTWDQQKLSAISFVIQPTYGWDRKTNQYDVSKKRQADVYVFCVHKHKEQSTINPLDTAQWLFYLITTDKLNETIGDQRTISLSSLIKIGAIPCAFEELHEQITKLFYSQKARHDF